MHICKQNRPTCIEMSYISATCYCLQLIQVQPVSFHLLVNRSFLLCTTIIVKPCIKLGSHCRSDQLDHPDHPNSPIRPDQARLKAYTRLLLDLLSITHDSHTIIHDSFTTSTRPPFRFPLDHPDLYTSPTRSQLDLLDLCSIGVRSFPDQIVVVVLES